MYGGSAPRLVIAWEQIDRERTKLLKGLIAMTTLCSYVVDPDRLASRFPVEVVETLLFEVGNSCSRPLLCQVGPRAQGTHNFYIRIAASPKGHGRSIVGKERGAKRAMVGLRSSRMTGYRCIPGQ